jgi:hypothetical protein
MRRIAVNVLFIMGLFPVPAIYADMADIRVYKGELRIIVPDKQTRNSMTIRYRSKTREVVRIALDDLRLTNMSTKQVINLPNQSAGLMNRIDHEGFWNTDVMYDDLDLAQDDYRIEGQLTLYLIGTQRTSNFSAYLEPRTSNKPVDSSIDWGLGK